LIKIDIAHGQEKFSGKPKGLLIENNREFKIDDKGKRMDYFKVFASPALSLVPPG
jgi:hypothetical protein